MLQFLQKPISDIFGATRRFFAKNTLKSSKNAIFGRVDKCFKDHPVPNFISFHKFSAEKYFVLASAKNNAPFSIE